MARPSLLPASFRGIPFQVEAAEGNFGRRSVRHDFPQRDLPYYEDMGRKAREFRVTAFLLGDDYLQQLDRLQGACEAAGPGELVHPYRGTMRVQCVDASVAFSSTEGRMARLSLTFGEAGEQRFPAVEPDPASSTAGAGSALKDLALREFAEDLQILGVPEYVRDAASNEVEQFGKDLLDLDVFGGARDKVAELRRRVTGLIRDAGEKISSPFDLGAEVVLTVDAIVGSAASESAALAALMRLIARGPFPHDDDASARNAGAVTNLISRTAIASGGGVAAGAAYETRPDALAARDALADAIDDAAATASDEVYQALMDLRTAICAALPPPNQDLPELGSVTLPATTPAIVVAYELYADPSRDAQIVARNRVRHPGFLPASTPLEILIDA